MSTNVSPIRDEDVPCVADFLYAHMNPRIPADVSARCIDVPRAVDRPDAGFMLVDHETVVGVQLAFYSERTVDGRRQRFCNVGAITIDDTDVTSDVFETLGTLAAFVTGKVGD